MDPANAKSARLSVVVAACGVPETVTLWTVPERNERLMTAVKEDRVLTVRPGQSGKKEYGEVGFSTANSTAHLVFPKPLTRFRGRRIVGIKYDLVKPPPPVGELVRRGRPRGRRSAGGSAPTNLPRSRRVLQEHYSRPALPTLYRVTLRFTSTVDTTQTVEAESRKAARTQALRNAELPEMKGGTVTRRIIRVSRL